MTVKRRRSGAGCGGVDPPAVRGGRGAVLLGELTWTCARVLRDGAPPWLGPLPRHSPKLQHSADDEARQRNRKASTRGVC